MKYKRIVPLFIVLTLVLIALVIPYLLFLDNEYNLKNMKHVEKVKYTSNSKIEYPYFNDNNINRAIRKKLNSVKYDAQFKIGYVKNKYLSLFIYGEGNYDYLLFDLISNKKITVEDLFLEKNIEKLNAKIKAALDKKYPKFVANSLKSSDTKRAYYLNGSEMIIYFYDYKMDPMVKEEHFVTINFSELDNMFVTGFSINYIDKNEYTIDPSKKTVAFTFDDGPLKKNTTRLVQALSDVKAHATFFMVGYMMNNNKDIVLNVLDAGNEIGSHSYSHKYLTRLNNEELKKDFSLTNETYKNITGKDLELLRPPYGSINENVRKNTDLKIITWNNDTLDWKYKDEDYLYDYLLNNLHDGDIVLMHDIHNTTVDAVIRALPQLYAKGFQIVSVSELAETKGVTLTNGVTYKTFK